MRDASVDFHLRRSATGSWSLNGKDISLVTGCVDLDFGFTPATNALTLRRLDLSVGDVADLTSAWLDVERGLVEPLMQRYERRTQDAYWYEASRFDYAAQLCVAPSGFVTDYPGLWVAEGAPPAA
jgi:hypothetical protein